MKPLRGAMIGAGYFARFQAEAWRRIPAAEIVAVADAAPGKARQFAQEFGIPRDYQSVEEMLEAQRPDFVDIVTRPEGHLELTAAAARRGIHVICQKPMAPTWDDCLAMCDACDRAGVRLLIHENWRWQPWYREVRRLLAEDTLGDAFQISFFWRTGDGQGPEPYAAQPYFRQMPRLLVYETLVHLLDTFRFLFGEIESIFCQNRRLNPVIVGEDQSLIQVQFVDGRLGLIDANRHSGPVPAPVAMGTLVVEGDRVALRVSPHGRLFLSQHGESEVCLPFDPPVSGYKGDSVLATQLHLVEALRSGSPSESDGRDYLKTVALVEACYASAETGRPVSPSQWLPTTYTCRFTRQNAESP
jgi:predicted dehydrogenase